MCAKKMPSRESKYFRERVEKIGVAKGKSISQLLKEMSKTGFQGRKLGEVVDVWEEMLKQRDLTIYMGLAGSMSTTGMWKLLCWLIENRFIDVLVPTGANISEDILEGMGGTYWQGSPLVDDAELYREKIDRFYDVFVDEYQYREMEKLLKDFIKTLDTNRNYSSREFLYLLGKELSQAGIESIVSSAYKTKVPVYCPAIVDSGYGVAAVLAAEEGFKVNIDQMKDFLECVEIAKKADKTGVVYIGGGIPKDFTQLLAVAQGLTRGMKDYPHEYAIQITVDAPHWGGLSGCTLEEAISWGKTSPRGKNVTCYCDATIALPLVVHALAERVERREHFPDFSGLFRESTA